MEGMLDVTINNQANHFKGIISHTRAKKKKTTRPTQVTKRKILVNLNCCPLALQETGIS